MYLVADTPIKRSDIIKSYFISQLLWLIIGITFAGIAVALSVSLHGFPFDRNTDIFMLFVVGIGISLFMGAIFYPLFYLGGEERNEVFLIVSLLCGIGIIMGLSAFLSFLFPKVSTSKLVLEGLFMLFCAVLTFTLSLPLTVKIFAAKEY